VEGRYFLCTKSRTSSSCLIVWYLIKTENRWVVLTTNYDDFLKATPSFLLFLLQVTAHKLIWLNPATKTSMARLTIFAIFVRKADAQRWGHFFYMNPVALTVIRIDQHWWIFLVLLLGPSEVSVMLSRLTLTFPRSILFLCHLVSLPW